MCATLWDRYLSNTKSPKQHGWIKQLMGSNGFACQSEEIGKALTDRTRVVRKLSTKKKRTQSGTRVWEQIGPLCQIGFSPVRNYLAR